MVARLSHFSGPPRPHRGGRAARQGDRTAAAEFHGRAGGQAPRRSERPPHRMWMPQGQNPNCPHEYQVTCPQGSLSQMTMTLLTFLSQNLHSPHSLSSCPLRPSSGGARIRKASEGEIGQGKQTSRPLFLPSSALWVHSASLTQGQRTHMELGKSHVLI